MQKYFKVDFCLSITSRYWPIFLPSTERCESWLCCPGCLLVQYLLYVHVYIHADPSRSPSMHGVFTCQIYNLTPEWNCKAVGSAGS